MKIRRKWWRAGAFGLILHGVVTTSAYGVTGHKPAWSVFAYAGQWTRTRIHEVFVGNIERKPCNLWAVGGSRRLDTFMQGRLALDNEWVLATYTGLQNHQEISSTLNLRYSLLPEGAPLTFAILYGVGGSYAFSPPPIERYHRSPSRFLVSMPVEVNVGFPGLNLPSWEVLFRVHHRSGAYGVISSADGSNVITLGIRYHF